MSKQKGMQMSKKKHHHHKNVNRESQLDFEEAKDLTVGQVIRKKEEVEAGVTPMILFSINISNSIVMKLKLINLKICKLSKRKLLKVWMI